MTDLPEDPVARVRAFLETRGGESRIFHTDETIITRFVDFLPGQ